MPGTPVPDVRARERGLSYTADRPWQGLTFILSYYDLAPAEAPRALQDAVVAVREEFVDMWGGRVTSDRPLSLNGHPGRDLEIAGGPDSNCQVARIYLVRVGGTARIYILRVEGESAQRNSPLVRKFLDSFALQPGLPPAPIGGN
jgi:hypothetical protein